MFKISSEPIAAPEMNLHNAGGFVTFEGKVRNHNEGRQVERLEYEAFEPLAVSEGEALLQEAKRLFGVLEIQCIHRVGLLELGETAVWIGVAAAHRKEAFEACEYVIDELKKRVPIWKKEHYQQGDSGWINNQPQQTPASLADSLYSRQKQLKEVGEAGQTKLKEAKVLVIGAGGLGCPVLTYLAAAGVGTLGICDFDVVNATNLHRQPLFDVKDVGYPKVEIASRAIQTKNPLVEVREHPLRLTPGSAAELFPQYDLIIDCTDNFRTKFLINDAAVQAKTPLIQSSIYQFEGQIYTVDPNSNGGCLRCIWPEAPYEGCVGTCAEVGVLGVVPGVFGMLQANEALKWILGLESPLSSEMLILDLKTYSLSQIARAADPNCPTCGAGTKSETSYDFRYGQDEPSTYVLIDIREPDEDRTRIPQGFAEVRHIPMAQIPDQLTELGQDTPYVLMCARGARSERTVKNLRDKGFHNFKSFEAGADGIATP